MKTISENIRRIAGKILEQGKVEGVIGFRKAGVDTMAEPFMAKTGEDAGQLIFDSHCRMNLVTYLTGRTGKLGITVKGCDSRNLVTHLIENKVHRENLYIIGVPCTGLTDKRAPAGTEVLQSNCRTCIQRNPVIFDELAGPLVEELKITDRFSDIEQIEALTPDKKQAFFDDLLQGCTRCYACRNACPLCYCPTCFVDESRPQWVGKTNDPTDIKTYHLLRAFHDAGRCTDCGACEAACPMGIKMRFLTRKTIKECVERYGFEAGLSLERRPALDRFSLNDPQEFIR